MDSGVIRAVRSAGLSGEVTYKGVYHEHVRSAETNEIIEDKIFHILAAAACSGQLIKEFDGGRNAWITIEELKAKEKKYLSTDIETGVGLGEIAFIEKTQVYTNEEF